MNPVFGDVLLHQGELLVEHDHEIVMIPLPVFPDDREPGDQVLDALGNFIKIYHNPHTPLSLEV